MEGNFIEGRFRSKTAKRLIKEWAEIHSKELHENWQISVNKETFNKIDPLE